MSTIIAIASSVVSTVLAFILTSTIRENIRLKKERDEQQTKRNEALENGVVCILRKQLMDEHDVWTTKGYITSHALESGSLMYKAYKELGGNGMIDHMDKDIQALPIKD